MGELIKTLTTLNIAGQDFSIELNHPSGNSSEHELHIQSDKFRWSLSERNFYMMASCVLLAKKQLEIIKSKNNKPSTNDETVSEAPDTFICEKEIYGFFDMLNKSNIPYVLIKNINGKLPRSLKNGKRIDILVQESAISEFENVMISEDYIKIPHPLGIEKGWRFAYNLPACQFWHKKTSDYNFFIDVNFKLCCKSLMPKIWIPVDESINNSIWQMKVFDSQNNWWIMDEKNLVVYLIARSIFDKQRFSKQYISEIEKRVHLLEDDEVKDKLSRVFFRYAPRLIKMINDRAYDNLVEDYITFSDY